MSDCSTHKDEYPGVKRIIVHFTDPNEHDFEWPFVPLEREIAYIMVDGETWVRERICEFSIKDNMNETEGMGDVWIECSACNCVFDFYADEWLMKMSYCPSCGARKVNK